MSSVPDQQGCVMGLAGEIGVGGRTQDTLHQCLRVLRGDELASSLRGQFQGQQTGSGGRLQIAHTPFPPLLLQSRGHGISKGRCAGGDQAEREGKTGETADRRQEQLWPAVRRWFGFHDEGLARPNDFTPSRGSAPPWNGASIRKVHRRGGGAGGALRPGSACPARCASGHCGGGRAARRPVTRSAR
jgi:hypothetical protein